MFHSSLSCVHMFNLMCLRTFGSLEHGVHDIMELRTWRSQHSYAKKGLLHTLQSLYTGEFTWLTSSYCLSAVISTRLALNLFIYGDIVSTKAINIARKRYILRLRTWRTQHGYDSNGPFATDPECRRIECDVFISIVYFS
jgi:hypothetical protein